MGAPARPAASRMHTTSSARLAPKRRTLDEDGCWQDCEIRFDAKLRSITPRGGECVIDRMEHIEDTKGNNGESGQLLVTNLRIIWVCERKKRTNLSIGHDAIVSMQIRSAESRLRGTTQALYVMTHFNDARFEFVFTNLVRGSPRLFTTMQAVYKAYDTSRLYRELKLRGAIIKDGALELLPREEIVSTANKVWNLAADSQSLGTYVVTNVRLVWHAEKAQSYNASLPYVQMRSIALRESKFGRTLVIELTKRAGGYVLGFRADTETKLKAIFKELQALHAAYSATPIFGVDFQTEERAGSLAELHVPSCALDNVESVDDEETSDSFSAYMTDDFDAAEREVVVSDELGLAIEKLPAGCTIKSLWSVI